MAAVAEFSLLFFVVINNIHAEEHIIIRKAQGFYTFNLPEETDFCQISRFVGEEKLVLRNTSDLWSNNSAVPEDLKRQLPVVNGPNISSYTIRNLTPSDSGRYQEECWTEGKVKYEKNISIVVCSTMDESQSIPVRLGATVDLPCEGAADNQNTQWLKREFRYDKDIWTRVFEDGSTSVMDNVQGRHQLVKTTSALRLSNFTVTIYKLYICLVMNQQQCVSSHPVRLNLPPEIIYHSVEETAVLQCTVADFSDDQPPRWKKLDLIDDQEVGQNYSLVFSSLTLNHSGLYFCQAYINVQTYWLLVCPKFGPPAVEFLSEGDDVTLRCREKGKGKGFIWFMKSNQTEGRTFSVLSVMSEVGSRLNISDHDAGLVISNASLEDTGEYWCAVVDPDHQCVATSKTLLKYREPFGIHSTFYIVRSSLLSGLLVILCVVAVAVIQRTRRGEQRPAQTQSYYTYTDQPQH